MSFEVQHESSVLPFSNILKVAKHVNKYLMSFKSLDTF